MEYKSDLWKTYRYTNTYMDAKYMHINTSISVSINNLQQQIMKHIFPVELKELKEKYLIILLAISRLQF